MVAILAFTAVYVGLWASAAPHSFFTSFPGAGHHRVTPLGPYDEHLTRDVGGLCLAMSAISTWAAIRPHQETFVVVGLAWLVFGIPHLTFHCLHLGMFSTADAAGNVITRGTVVLSALLLVPAPRRGVRCADRLVVQEPR
ncbi:MAG: DUF4345 family protein [Marmoricola sp.]